MNPSSTQVGARLRQSRAVSGRAKNGRASQTRPRLWSGACKRQSPQSRAPRRPGPCRAALDRRGGGQAVAAVPFIALSSNRQSATENAATERCTRRPAIIQWKRWHFDDDDDALIQTRRRLTRSIYRLHVLPRFSPLNTALTIEIKLR